MVENAGFGRASQKKERTVASRFSEVHVWVCGFGEVDMVDDLGLDLEYGE